MITAAILCVCMLLPKPTLHAHDAHMTLTSCDCTHDAALQVLGPTERQSWQGVASQTSSR